MTDRASKLQAAILELAHPGPCWCDYGIGHPEMGDHSETCRRLRALMADRAEPYMGDITGYSDSPPDGTTACRHTMSGRPYARGRGKSEAARLAERMLRESGQEPCEHCSNDNWRVFHRHGAKPDKCPKRDEAHSAVSGDVEG